MKRPIFSNRSAQKMWDYLDSIYEDWDPFSHVLLDHLLEWVEDTFEGRNPKYKKKHAKDTKKD